MYVPERETLAEALNRVQATGLDREQAKKLICATIRDLRIGVRVEIDNTDRDIPR